MADKNAARLLYERLKQWRETPGGSSVLQHRASGTSDWWTPHSEAVAWLEEIRAQLEQLDIDDGADEDDELLFASGALDRIRQAVFSTEARMDDAPAGSRTHLDLDDLAALQLLSKAWRSAPANGPSVRGLVQVAREAEDLVIGATHLDDETRDYLLQLIQHLQKALTSIAVHGPLDARRLANELTGALYATFGDGDQAERQKAENLLQRAATYVKNLIFVDAVPTVVKSISSSGADQLMLPPGSQ